MSIRVGLAVLCLLAVLGCSAKEEPEPLPPITAPSASPTPLAVPSEAVAETPQGAAAFTRYFFGSLVNQAYVELEPALLDALTTADCGSCDSIQADIQRLRDGGVRVDGQRFKIAFAEAPPSEPDGSIIVDFRYTSDPYIEKDRAGATVREEPAQVDQDAQVKLVRREGGWAVDAIRTVGT